MLKDTLPHVHVQHTLGHQREGIHAVGNSAADTAAKAAVATIPTVKIAAVTRSQTRIDSDILAAIGATEGSETPPEGFPQKYSYKLHSDTTPTVTIPGVGNRIIPNKISRPGIIKAANEGLASAPAGRVATPSLIQQRYWWPKLHKHVKQHVKKCTICQQIKHLTIKGPKQTPLMIASTPFRMVFWDLGGSWSSGNHFKYILVAVESCSRFLWVWPKR